MEEVCQAITAAACLIVIIRSEGAINRMTRATNMLVRLSFMQIAASAVAGLLAIGIGYVPGWREILMSWGVAALMICDRRLRRITSAADRRAAQ